MPLAAVVLHHLAQHAALGVEHREAGPDLVGEAEQVELAAESPVVATLGLLDPVQVGVQRVLGLPCGAVDPLQLLVVLVAAPVRRRGAQQPERRDPLGGGQVRAAAQVLPRHRAVALEVVVDGELARADLDRRALGRVLQLGTVAAALEPDQLKLVRLVGELRARLVVADLTPGEPLALLDDLAHPGLDALDVVGLERLRDVEVVVEAVGDRRPDAELRLREQVLHRLGENVRGRVPQDVAAVGRVDPHRLDPVAVGELVGQVAQLGRRPAPRSRRHRSHAGKRRAPRPWCPS